jgi:hypothetical protein
VRSSPFASRLTLGLWIVAGLIAAALIAFVAVTEFRPSRKDRVNDYIAEVNDVERQLSIEISRVNQAYRQFGGKTPLGTLVPKLQEAEQTISTLHDRVAELEPPADAAELHRALLRLLDEDERVAQEVTAMAVYLEELQRESRPIEPAALELRKRLTNAKTSDEQVAAFEAYAAAVDAVRIRLEQIERPPALAPSHRALLKRLETTASLTRQLQAAARRHDSATAAYLIQRLRLVATPTPATRRAEIAAIKAYNTRIGRVEDRARDVARAQQELSKSLG